MTRAGRIGAVARLPLVQSSAALLLNTGINGALGLAYWVLAARLDDPSVVGRGAAGISGLLFVASLGWIGLQQVLLRFLPRAGRDAARLIVRVYAAATAIALAAALGFLLYASGDASLRFLVESPSAILAFLGAVVIWVVFSLQDPALIGLRRSPWVPLENLAFGAAKLVLLALLATVASPWAILGSWVLGASWLIFVVNALIRRTTRDDAEPADMPEPRRLVRFAVGQHAIAVVIAAPDSLAPLVVLAILGDEATAFYYSAWTVSFTLRLLAVNLGSAVTVEGSRADASSSHLTRQVRFLAPFVILPAVGGVWLLAGFVMGIFGVRYADEASDLLRLLAAAVIPFTVVTLFVVGERIAERTSAALVVVTITTVATLALNVVLLPRYGLVAAGWSWLVAQLLGLFAAGLISRRRRVLARG